MTFVVGVKCNGEEAAYIVPQVLSSTVEQAWFLWLALRLLSSSVRGLKPSERFYGGTPWFAGRSLRRQFFGDYIRSCMAFAVLKGKKSF